MSGGNGYANGSIAAGGSQSDWDAIVIGSGIGGLTTAAFLATNGLRTLVLEQYDTAGGSSQVFRRKRMFEFDVGLHYVGDCAPRGWDLYRERLFDRFPNEREQILKCTRIIERVGREVFDAMPCHPRAMLR